MSGWACLHRSIDSHWIFDFNEPDKALAWIYLLVMANHKDQDIMIKGRVLRCKRGQLVRSQITLQNKFKWSQNKLKRFLKLLKNERMIDYETNDLTTIITICNYDKYQENYICADDQTNEQADDQTNEARTTNNNVKQIIDISTNVDIRKSSLRIPYEEIIKLYHEALPMMTQVYKLTETRKKRIKYLWDDGELDGLEYWANYFNFVSKSKFLTGRSHPGKDGRTWKADLDFIIHPTNYIKITEEKYHEQKIQTIGR